MGSAVSGDSQPCSPQLTLPCVWGSAGGRLAWGGLAGTPTSGPPAAGPTQSCCAAAARKQCLSPARMKGGADCRPWGAARRRGRPWTLGALPGVIVPPVAKVRSPEPWSPRAQSEQPWLPPAPRPASPQSISRRPAGLRAIHLAPTPEAPTATPAKGAARPARQSARTGNSCPDAHTSPLHSVCINTLSAWSRGLALPANQSADTSAHGRHSMFPAGLRSVCSSIL